MDIYRFETTVLDNGTIFIPDFEKFKKQNVEVSLILKSEPTIENKEEILNQFLDKWFGHFPQIETEDVRYNAIIGKEK